MTDTLMSASKRHEHRQAVADSPPGSGLIVDVVHHGSAWEGMAENEFLVRAVTAVHALCANDTTPSDVSLLLTGDDEIRALNKDWRGKDAATNVLSFPLDAPYCGEGTRSLGDIALGFETVAREAAQRAIPVHQHAAHLVVHGMLHLLGYTHDTDSQAQAMEALEVRVLAGLGLPDPYATDAMISGEGQ